ncbi:MAG: hypothetical protein HND57_01605 [Planctomycetes bacterium]|nr:hypothetical protein [Planctomycetota bacterium]
MPTSNFLPEDYVSQRAEHRSNTIGLALFIVIMVAVVAAFLVTNQQWNTVKQEQQRINVAYSDAARQIETLNEMESQKRQILERAEVTAALVERVPRSILLAELINRMPPPMSLMSVELHSIRIKTPPPQKAKKSEGATTVLSIKDKANQRIPTRSEEDDARAVEVPKYTVAMTIIGFAPTDVHVSDYLRGLTDCSLFQAIQLKYSRETSVGDQLLRKFEIDMELNPNADAKGFEPLKLRRGLKGGIDPTPINPLPISPEMTGVKLGDETPSDGPHGSEEVKQ